MRKTWLECFAALLQGVAIVVWLTGCGVVTDSVGKQTGTEPAGSPTPGASVIDATRPLQSVPRAVCGPGSQPETGIQGQVPRADRVSGRSQYGYWCNLELVASARQGEGASWQFAWYDDCGYYGTLYNANRTTKQGAVVIDASDPENPFVSAILDTPAVMDPHESLKVNEKRGLLAAVQLSGGPYTAPQETTPDDWFDVYDVKGDCAHPKLLASVEFPETRGHEGHWFPDGQTYLGSGGSSVNAIDVTDPSNPTLIAKIGYASHGVNASDDGNRIYLSPIVGSVTSCPGAGALQILDSSQIQARAANLTLPIPKIGEICWSDGAIPQHPIPITIKGKPYVISVDEGGRGAARIFDISNEASPALVSKLKLEVHLDQYAAFFQIDGAQTDNALFNAIFVYDGHYCAVDDPHEAMTVACGYFESGIRVFDIRDPRHPKEIAYYMPPAKFGPLLGSSHGGGTADHCASQVRFIPERGELWTQCQDNEFMVLRFTNGVWPFKDGRLTTVGDEQEP